MRKQILLFTLSLFISVVAHAQVVVVNPDGTHSVGIKGAGSTVIVINRDGTHSVVPNTGNSSVVFNPNMPKSKEKDHTNNFRFHKKSSTKVDVNKNLHKEKMKKKHQDRKMKKLMKKLKRQARKLSKSKNKIS